MVRSLFMPTDQIVALLVAERDRLNRAIEALQGPAKRRGRPPKSLAAASVAPVPTTKGRKRRMGKAARDTQSKRMKAYWARRKKEASK